jgi:hypothetical protein
MMTTEHATLKKAECKVVVIADFPCATEVANPSESAHDFPAESVLRILDFRVGE